MFLETYNTEFDEIIITDRNWRSLEIEDKVNLNSLLININDASVGLSNATIFSGTKNNKLC